MNLGNDADTVGAIYGQIAGAYYGAEAIPENWRANCSLTPLIETVATELSRLADCIEPPDVATYQSTDWSSTFCPVAPEKCEIANTCLLLLLLFFTKLEIQFIPSGRVTRTGLGQAN